MTIKVTNNLLGLYKGSEVVTTSGIGVLYETNYSNNTVLVQFKKFSESYHSYEVRLILNEYEKLSNEELSQIALISSFGNNFVFVQNFERLKKNKKNEQILLMPIEMLILAKKQIDIFGLIGLKLACSYDSDVVKRLLALERD